jgi:hypothetical protein
MFVYLRFHVIILLPTVTKPLHLLAVEELLIRAASGCKSANELQMA